MSSQRYIPSTLSFAFPKGDSLRLPLSQQSLTRLLCLHALTFLFQSPSQHSRVHNSSSIFHIHQSISKTKHTLLQAALYASRSHPSGNSSHHTANYYQKYAYTRFMHLTHIRLPLISNVHHRHLHQRVPPRLQDHHQREHEQQDYRSRQWRRQQRQAHDFHYHRRRQQQQAGHCRQQDHQGSYLHRLLYRVRPQASARLQAS
jgi:hypothetical protein